MSDRERRQERGGHEHVPRRDDAPRRFTHEHGEVPQSPSDERTYDSRSPGKPPLTERERRERWPLG